MTIRLAIRQRHTYLMAVFQCNNEQTDLTYLHDVMLLTPTEREATNRKSYLFNNFKKSLPSELLF